MVMNLKPALFLLLYFLIVGLLSCSKQNTDLQNQWEEQLLNLKESGITVNDIVSIWGEPSMISNNEDFTILFYSFGPAQPGKGLMITGGNLKFVQNELESWDWVYGQLLFRQTRER